VNELEESFLNARRFALCIVLVQIGLALLAGLICFLLEGTGAGISALTGGAIGALASFYMVVSMFRHGPKTEPAKVLRSIYQGEFFKLALTAGLFALAIRFLEVSFGPMIGGFAATFVVYWVALGLGLPSNAAVSED
tara:strand:- start:155 stop:565 length:411 start_codon:yes stop_codon:yes gene_type:complete